MAVELGSPEISLRLVHMLLGKEQGVGIVFFSGWRPLEWGTFLRYDATQAQGREDLFQARFNLKWPLIRPEVLGNTSCLRASL